MIPAQRPSPTDAVRLWPAKVGHLIQDVAGEQCLGRLPSGSAGPKAIPDDRLVPEAGVLHAGLLMVARLLLPPSPSDLRHLLDRVIASARLRSTSRHGRSRGRWNHDCRATRTSGIVEGDRVVGRVHRDPCDFAFDYIDQIDGSRRVIDISLGQGMGDDRTRSVDTQMELLSASPAASSVFRGGPFTCAYDRASRAVDDEMSAFARGDSTKREVEVLAAP